MKRKSVHIIAEAGTNHNGQLQKARNLVEIAKKAGADSVKFQIINPWGLYLPGQYEYGHYDINEVIRLRQQTVLPDEWYWELKEYSTELGVGLSASIFDTKGLELLQKLQPEYIKIASCDLNNISFLRKVAEADTKIVLSTGMSELSEIEKTVKALEDIQFKKLVLMHCVSVYPSTADQTNLSFISKLKSEFGYEVGFSDHTQTSLAACVAVSLGATWIEKHFTEDRSQIGLDHPYAMEPEMLTQYIQDIRSIERALVENVTDKVSDGEKYTKRRARRSLYASKDLEVGDVITEDDVLLVRPENELSADQFDEIIGQTLKTKLEKHQPFTLHHF